MQHRRLAIPTLFAFLLLLALAACVRAAAPTSGGAPPMQRTAAGADTASYAMAEVSLESAGGLTAAAAPAAEFDRGEAGGAAGGPSGGGAVNLGRIQQSATDRFLIKNATVTLEAKNPAKAADQLRAEVLQLGGYVSNLQASVDKLGGQVLTMAVRIPAKDFDLVMGKIGALGTALETNIGTQDVTEEFVDVQARVHNLKETELRLLSHLQDSRKVEDTLRIESELTRVRGEIEQLEGRLRYLSHRIDFSTISLTIRPMAAPEPVVPPESYSVAQVVSGALREVIGFLRVLVATLIWLGIWGIVWVPLALLVWLIVRRLRVRLQPPATPSTPTLPAATP
ncbi:MAG TPA: DUF4349 domain-containing protein [bacterium]|nr:DUF4349 domain-containing protein [bacterium]